MLTLDIKPKPEHERLLERDYTPLPKTHASLKLKSNLNPNRGKTTTKGKAKKQKGRIRHLV